MIPRQSLAAVFLGALLATSVPANDPKPRLDRHGDPLPEHAIARIGTVRLRHGGPVTALAFSPDGKTLASAGADRTISLWNVSDGQERLRIRIESDNVRTLSYEHDGKALLSWHPDGPVRRWDPTTGKELPAFPDWPRVAHAAAFSADGCAVVTLYAPYPKESEKPRPPGELCVWDARTGKLLRSVKDISGNTLQLTLSPNGKTLAALTDAVSVWDVNTGTKILEKSSPRHPKALGFASNGRLVYVFGDKAQFWDLKTRKAVDAPITEKWPDNPRRGIVSTVGDALLISDDTIRLWNLSKREIRAKLQGLPMAQVAAFSADGLLIATGDELGVVLLLAGTDLKVQSFVSHMKGGKVIGRILNDQKTLMTQSAPFQLQAHDLATGRQLKDYSRKSNDELLDVAPDGKHVVVTQRQWYSLWLEKLQPGNDDNARPLTVHDDNAVWIQQSKFLSDRSSLTVSYRSLGVLGFGAVDHYVGMNDLKTGKPVHSWGPIGGSVGPLAVSRNQQLMAFPVATGASWEPTTIHLHSLNSDKPIADGQDEKVIAANRIEFSPDSNYVAHWYHQNSERNPYDSTDGNLYFWELSTKKSALTIKQPKARYFSEVAFRRDGRLVGLGQSDGDIVLWDLVTATERRRLKGHRGPIHSLAFTDDGRKLVSGGSDSSAVIWDVKDLLTPPKPTGPAPTARQLESLWADLAGEDAQKGFRAITTLAATPEQVMPFLQERLKPVAPLPAEQIQKLLADLNAQRFATRQRAREELVTQGRAIVHALKKALEGEPPLEARRRIEDLLTELKDHRPADALRLSRALLALEYIGNSDARKLLQSLSAGAPGAWLTDQAQAALARRVAD